MSDLEASSDPDETSRRLLGVRLAIGLAQGLALYGLSRLYDQKPAPALFGALVMAAIFLPVAALGGVGALRIRTLGVWLLGVLVIVAGLGAYDGWVQADKELMPHPVLLAATGAGLFIAHHLVLGADAERRWIADYRRYFDAGWKDAVRLGLSVAFVGALWAMLGLGAALFHLIELEFFAKLITKRWFTFPVTATAFALAVHLTDSRAGLVRGARTLALTLLAFLTPVMTLIVAGFVAALPFSGLEPLWSTRRAAAILLAAAAALVVLLNAAYQDGARDGFPPRLLRWIGRLTGVLIAPLVLIAAYGLWIRVSQYGLTPERIYAIACMVVGLCYGVGYAWAAVSKGPWLRRLEPTNVVAAHLVIAVLLVLFTPLGDPRRLSVDSQLRRLEAGLAPARFDYDFLRFDAGRYGREALRALTLRAGAPLSVEIATLAREAEARSYRRGYGEPGIRTRARVEVLGGGALPESFRIQAWTDQQDPMAFCGEERMKCEARLADLNGDGETEIIFIRQGSWTAYSQSDGRWREVGSISRSRCDGARDALAAGRFQIVPPRAAWSDIEIDGRRHVIQNDSCEAADP
jgi:hypothetical protein